MGRYPLFSASSLWDDVLPHSRTLLHILGKDFSGVFAGQKHLVEGRVECNLWFQV